MDVKTMSHRDDPDTSTIAAVAVDMDDSRQIRRAIVDMLADKPMTDGELKQAYTRQAFISGWPMITDLHNIPRRRSELHRKLHVVRDSGDRHPTQYGRPAVVWELAVPIEEAQIIVAGGAR